MGGIDRDSVLGGFSRPFGTESFFKTYPGLASWAIFSRPFGTLMVFRPWLRWPTA
jgi:hypothetical protein